MKKNFLLTVAITSLFSFSNITYAKTATSPTASQSQAKTFTILEHYHLHEAKADFDEPLWQSYL